MMLQIISPEGTQSHQISWLECDTAEGNFVIQKGHSPTVLALLPDKPCIIGFDETATRSLSVNQAIIYITPEKIIIFSQHVVG